MIYFSLIIPTFNVASTLSRCLDSFVAQNYSHFEAALIGSMPFCHNAMFASKEAYAKVEAV